MNTTNTETLERKTTVVSRNEVNILIVDDRPENLLSLESLLVSEGRNLIKASSGSEALKIAFETSIALIILDVQMPEMDGFEVARLLKENPRTKDIAIVFVTALSENEKYTLQGYEEGAVDYLHKPLIPAIVKAKVCVYESLYKQSFELKESNQKLKEINKQLDEFVYIVSHDLKAPLRGLSSISSFLEDELGSDLKPEVAELLGLIKKRTAWMQNLVSSILHYSRMSNSCAVKEDAPVKELIENIIEIIDPPENFKFEVADNLPVLRAEKIKIHEVFQNLISNGIKYNNKEHGLIRIGFYEYPDHYDFYVQDNGQGIKPEHFERIFGIFQTLSPKENTDSTGIGLTIVKKIVEQQGGKVSLTSEYGEGTKFTFSWRK